MKTEKCSRSLISPAVRTTVALSLHGGVISRRRVSLNILKKTGAMAVFAGGLLLAGLGYGAEPEMRSFRGVVTYHLIPAKVIQVNAIVEDPEPGTSYIGEEAILVEFAAPLDVMANSTVVSIEYYEYEEPKTIRHELFGEHHELTVKYHAERVVIEGNISDYIAQ